jgi:hypothetical protein
MEEILMKRLALVLAAAALGTGCGSSSPPPPAPAGTLDLSWSFIRTKNDLAGTQVTYGCAQAGIDTVVVSTVDGSVALSCADQLGDGGAVGLAPGTYNVVVTAYRGGTALYTATFNGIVIALNQTTSILAPLDARFAPFQIDVDFQTLGGTHFATCASAGVDTYSFNLVDFAGTSVYASGNIACTNPPGILFDSGNPVDLDAYTIRVVGSGPSFDFDSAVYPSCSSPVFHHYGNDVDAFAWNLPVYDVTGGPFCP